MEKLTALEMAEWSATGFTALFAGGAFFVNAVDMPAVKTVKDIRTMRQMWKAIFKGGGSVQVPFALASAASGVAAWYKCESDYRWVFLAGAGAMLSLMPYTALVMMPNIKSLMEDDVIENEGEEEVKNRISLWNKQHMFRTAVSILALDTFILGIFLTR